MIPVRGYRGSTVLVLGLGRSGLSAARALREGGAHVLVWDDGATARAAGDAEDFELRDPTGSGALDAVDLMVTSPGIPHLYPAPHPAIAAALEAGVPVDNDIGLFFASLANGDWEKYHQPPRVIAVTRSAKVTAPP